MAQTELRTEREKHALLATQSALQERLDKCEESLSITNVCRVSLTPNVCPKPLSTMSP